MYSFVSENIFLRKDVVDRMNNSAFVNFILSCIQKNKDYDWGDLRPKDYFFQDQSLKEGCGTTGEYIYDACTRVYIYTNANRSSTIISLSYGGTCL